MNTLQDSLSSLLPDAKAMAEMIMQGSREMFGDHGKVDPAMFHVPLVGEKIAIEDVEVLDDDTKPIVWAKLRRWRESFPVVAFVSEVWMAQFKGRKWDGKTMPRNHPDRMEYVMIQLWQGSRAVTIHAKITRNPDHLGEWEILFDSLFPKEGMDSLGGAMMDGKHCSMEGN